MPLSQRLCLLVRIPLAAAICLGVGGGAARADGSVAPTAEKFQEAKKGVADRLKKSDALKALPAAAEDALTGGVVKRRFRETGKMEGDSNPEKGLVDSLAKSAGEKKLLTSQDVLDALTDYVSEAAWQHTKTYLTDKAKDLGVTIEEDAGKAIHEDLKAYERSLASSGNGEDSITKAGKAQVDALLEGPAAGTDRKIDLADFAKIKSNYYTEVEVLFKSNVRHTDVSVDPGGSVGWTDTARNYTKGHYVARFTKDGYVKDTQEFDIPESSPQKQLTVTGVMVKEGEGEKKKD